MVFCALIFLWLQKIFLFFFFFKLINNDIFAFFKFKFKFFYLTFFLKDENQHAFCKSCILRWLKNGENRRCPIGNELILVDQLRSGPRIIRNLLSELGTSFYNN